MILDFLFPKYCLECKRPGKYICQHCLNLVPSGGLYRTNYSIFGYSGVIRKAIIALKYKFATDIADELVGACFQKLLTYNLPPTTVLIPIPLHWHKENVRGFNQTELLGEKLATALNWQFVPDLLKKDVNTKGQVGLRGVARRRNLSGVFAVNPLCSPSTNYGSLLLFDDVFTTGSTINEARKTLKDGGYKVFGSLTIAR